MNTLTANPMKSISETIQSAIKTSMSYDEYRVLVNGLAQANSNSGPVKTDALANYTQLNDRRMRRWDKTLKITESDKIAIQSMSRKVTWLVLTESWCGDASPSLPVMNKMSGLTSKLDLKIVLRDDNIDLMNLFLTNGSQSIPKLIALDATTSEVIGEWGPRPSAATQMVNDYKEKHGKLTAAFKEDLQGWYNKDKGQTTLGDLMKLLALK